MPGSDSWDRESGSTWIPCSAAVDLWDSSQETEAGKLTGSQASTRKLDYPTSERMSEAQNEVSILQMISC